MTRLIAVSAFEKSLLSFIINPLSLKFLPLEFLPMEGGGGQQNAKCCSTTPLFLAVWFTVAQICRQTYNPSVHSGGENPEEFFLSFAPSLTVFKILGFPRENRLC